VWWNGVKRSTPASKSWAYTYVTLDLEGYRSGKMNDTLAKKSNLIPLASLETRA